jgi:hypothetical protein
MDVLDKNIEFYKLFSVLLVISIAMMIIIYYVVD